MTKQQEPREKGIALAKTLMEGAPSVGTIPKRFREHTLSHLFGDVWQGPELDLPERSLLTCAMLVVLNRETEMRIHFNGARNLGVPRSKLEETIIQAAHYAGWPVAAAAFRALEDVWPETDSASNAGTGQ
ncbi:MAG: carboxymuconolactone decarboxylase family protein [Alphaproteobacteria bacterium]|nr:carboxymuconolactone decarboxylase family protein [Alphaproteobacteria bacterium]